MSIAVHSLIEGSSWYLPDVPGFVRDVKDPSVWAVTLGKVFFTFVVIAVVMLLWFAFR